MSAESPVRPQHLPFRFARRHGVLLLGGDRNGQARVAVRQGAELKAVLELRRFLGCPLAIEFKPETEFHQLLEQTYQSGQEELLSNESWDQGVDLNQLVDTLPQTEDLLESQDDAPIIRLLNALLTEAVKQGASDMHIEPFENRLSVRFRVDGVLQEVMAPPRQLAPLIVSRIKVMARLDIAEKRLPQDGRISLKVAGRPVDVRVSTLPSGHGERVVLRLLDKQAGRLQLDQLGMAEKDRQLLQRLIHRPHGILLVTGPTGSGKTTTLYAALQILNDSTRNIMTVEDPIEYYIDGIGQTQVNSKVDLSFARGLRAILRQDPDVVMVGEIRDLETAEIAIQASLTGHLVLSTLHTNSAVGAVTRLQDMGVEPFLLSSSLVGVVAQRLVRVLDPEHRQAYQPAAADLQGLGEWFAGETAQLHRPAAELPPGVSGYQGRTGIYEIVPLDDEIRQIIHQQQGEAALEAAARQRSGSILQDGWRKAKQGITSLEEVLRVTREQ